MESSFDLNRQTNKIESKIVVALERISESFRVLLWNESKQNSLSPIQIQILIFILFHAQEKCKVSYLAQEFNMTKPTISDSIKILLQKGFIEKFDDPLDTRSYTVGLTKTGRETAEKSAELTSAIEKPLTSLSETQKAEMLNGLLQLIYQLNKSGIITIQRMCFTCSNYQNNNDQHYCKLLQSKLTTSDLRVDCPEHDLVLA